MSNLHWKRTRAGEWVSRPWFIRGNAEGYALHRSDGSDFGKLILGGLPSLGEAKREAARCATWPSYPTEAEARAALRAAERRVIGPDRVAVLAEVGCNR